MLFRLPLQVFEAQGELMAVTTVKTPLRLPKPCSYDQYCVHSLAPNVEATVPLNFSSGFSSHAAEKSAAEGMSQAVLDQSDNEDAAEAERLAFDPFDGMDPAYAAGLAEASTSGTTSGLGKGAPLRQASSAGGVGPGASGSGVGLNHATSAKQKAAKTRMIRTESEDGSFIYLRHEGTGRKMRARFWLAKQLPINQQQLLPLLEVIGTSNQYIRKV
jgi:GPCR-chaperone